MKNPPFKLDMPQWLIELLPELPRHLTLRYDRPTDSFILHDSEDAVQDRVYERLKDLDRLRSDVGDCEAPVLVDWTTMRGMVDEPCSGLLAIPRTGTADNWDDPSAWGEWDDEGGSAGRDGDVTPEAGATDGSSATGTGYGPEGADAGRGPIMVHRFEEDRYSARDGGNCIILVINGMMDSISRYAEAYRTARSNIDAWRADPDNGILAWRALDCHPFAWHLTDMRTDEPLAPDGRVLKTNGLLPDIIHADIVRQDDGVLRAVTESGGRYDPKGTITCHDLALDVAAATTDEMYVRTMKLVDKYYNDDGTPRRDAGE